MWKVTDLSNFSRINFIDFGNCINYKGELV